MSSSVRPVNELILEILTGCGCESSSEYFEGMEKDEFRRMTLDDLKMRMRNEVKGDTKANKIFDYLEKFSRLGRVNSPASGERESDQMNLGPSTICSPGQHNREGAGRNTVDQEKRMSDSGTDSDDDYSPILAPVAPAPKPVTEVNLSDSEPESDSNPVSSENQSQDTQDISSSNVATGRYSLRQRDNKKVDYFKQDEDSDVDEKPSKRSKPDVHILSNPVDLLKKYARDASLVDECAKFKLVHPKFLQSEADSDSDLCTHTRNLHNCDYDDPEEEDYEPWEQFFKKLGKLVYVLDLSTWSWKSHRAKCPYNLLAFLRHCRNLQEITFKVNILPESVEKQNLPAGLVLPKLKKMCITHPGKIVYFRQLSSILEAATNFETLEYSFYNHAQASKMLEILKKSPNLQSFKCLILLSYETDGYLVQDHIQKLSELRAQNLQQLELGNGLWEDISGMLLENMLKTFPKLKRFKILGNCQGNSLRKPDIEFIIPQLSLLELVDIGGNYEFASVDQRSNRRQRFSNSNYEVITVDEELKTELFSATVKFALLPNLKTLILGNTFKVDEFHFSSFPKLEAMRVGSPWHLSVKFTDNINSRKYSYPLITELQIPDCLKDESFLQKIPARFPNLKKCWIFLPSVKVLRSFFKSMENSDLEELYLKTQFDFEITMELCLLNRPTQAPMKYQDYMLQEDLENYGKFEEFVSFYNIELPPKKLEEVSELEQSNNYAGVKALKSLKVLQLEHIPRVLRIPRGNLHWTHSKAEFTDDYIGFKEYPLSKACFAELPIMNLQSCSWPNFRVSSKATTMLRQQGFVNQDADYDMVAYSGPCSSSRSTPPWKKSASSRKSRGEKLKVQIQPAMLQANIKFRDKDEKK